MRPRIHVITLAVSDLERALRFYRDGLGLESPGVIGTEFAGDQATAAGAAAMFALDGGLILSLYPRSELAKDANKIKANERRVEFQKHYNDALYHQTLLVDASPAADPAATRRDAAAALSLFGLGTPGGEASRLKDYPDEEQKRLAEGKTYEPRTFIERWNWGTPADDPVGERSESRAEVQVA